MDWIDLAQDKGRWRALVNTIMDIRVPQNAGKHLSSCATGGFSRKAQLHESSQIAQHLNICFTDRAILTHGASFFGYSDYLMTFRHCYRRSFVVSSRLFVMKLCKEGNSTEFVWVI
jgi:hypothetical protein